jgi:hypothetical protein
MAAPEKFSMLRAILRTIGLSDEAAEDIIDRILAFLAFSATTFLLSPAELRSLLLASPGAHVSVCPQNTVSCTTAWS